MPKADLLNGSEGFENQFRNKKGDERGCWIKQ